MKWRPLLYCSACRQPRQAIAPVQYSNSKCVSRLRATLYFAQQMKVVRMFEALATLTSGHA